MIINFLRIWLKNVHVHTARAYIRDFRDIINLKDH